MSIETNMIKENIKICIVKSISVQVSSILTQIGKNRKTKPRIK